LRRRLRIQSPREHQNAQVRPVLFREVHAIFSRIQQALDGSPNSSRDVRPL
jgi:hypothetical protein